MERRRGEEEKRENLEGRGIYVSLFGMVTPHLPHEWLSDARRCLEFGEYLGF